MQDYAAKAPLLNAFEFVSRETATFVAGLLAIDAESNVMLKHGPQVVYPKNLPVALPVRLDDKAVLHEVRLNQVERRVEEGYDSPIVIRRFRQP